LLTTTSSTIPVGLPLEDDASEKISEDSVDDAKLTHHRQVKREAGDVSHVDHALVIDRLVRVDLMGVSPPHSQEVELAKRHRRLNPGGMSPIFHAA
jgi:hypothetical protein